MRLSTARKSHKSRPWMALFVLDVPAQGDTSMNAPGTCVDCGNEAYIRLAGERETMICAHCFAVRHPAEPAPTEKAPRVLSRLRLPSRRVDVR